jgi:hypothetical protein
VTWGDPVQLRRPDARAGLRRAFAAQGESGAGLSAGRASRRHPDDLFGGRRAGPPAEPRSQVVFFAIGFETTTPPTAVVIKQAQALGLGNFSVLCCHVLTPSAIASILESPEVRQWGSVPLDGFIGPAHVSTIIGSRPYEFFAEEYRKPVVIAGFEPLDVMQAILMLLRQVNDGRAVVENEFSRAVTRDGNRKAQQSGRRSLRTAPLVRLARARRAALQRAAHPQGIRRLRRRAPLRSATRRWPTTRPASVARSCAASSGRRNAGSSAACARRKTPSARAWCRRKGPARRTTRTAVLPTLAAVHEGVRKGYVRPLDLRQGRVDMTHGAVGGRWRN